MDDLKKPDYVGIHNGIKIRAFHEPIDKASVNNFIKHLSKEFDVYIENENASKEEMSNTTFKDCV